MAHRWVNAVILTATFALVAVTIARNPAELVSKPKHLGEVSQLRTLEANVGNSPNDTESLGKLVRAHLKNQEPGFAIAVVEHRKHLVENSVELTSLASQAYLDAGKASQALSMTRKALALCVQQSCPPSLLVRTSQREQILSILVRDGIEDIQANPKAVSFAYRKAVRPVQMAMRLPNRSKKFLVCSVNCRTPTNSLFLVHGGVDCNTGYEKISADNGVDRRSSTLHCHCSTPDHIALVDDPFR
jgi:hypothetical protein